MSNGTQDWDIAESATVPYPMQRQVIHHEETRSLGSASGKQVPLGGRQVRAGVLMKCESVCWSQFS